MGRLLLGYGEVEFWIVTLAGFGVGDPMHAFRVVFRCRSESQRLQVADALVRPKMKSLGLEAAYTDGYGAARHCLKIRNQYAHLHFHAEGKLLKITNMDDFAAKPDSDQLYFRPLTVQTLQEQDAYFGYTVTLLSHVWGEAQAMLGGNPALRLPMPAKQPQPNLDSRPN